jgi:hypothetical protein
MTTLRAIAARLMSWGVISSAWYAILTGTALLLVAWLLASGGGSDRAAPYVAVVLAVAGVSQLGRGIQVRPAKVDDER